MYEFSNGFWIKKAIYLALSFIFGLFFVFLWNYQPSDGGESSETNGQESGEITEQPVEELTSSVERPFDIDLEAEEFLTETTVQLAGADAYRYDLTDGATLTVAVEGFDSSETPRDFTWLNSFASGSVQLTDTPTFVCLDAANALCSAGNGVLNILVEPDSPSEGVLVQIDDSGIDEFQAVEKYQPLLESITLKAEESGL